MGPFKKYVTSIMSFFTPFNYFLHFVNFTLTLPLCYSLNFTKILQNEKKISFLCTTVSAYHAISEKVKNYILRHVELLDTHIR